MVGGNRVDPVPQLGGQADQANPVPQQRAELADLRRGDPRLREQVGAQQLRQDRRVDLVFSELRNGGPEGSDIVAVQGAIRGHLRPRWIALTSSNEEEAGEPFSVGCRFLAVSRWIEHQTGCSIRKFTRTARHYRTIEIQAGNHVITAADPLPDDLRAALDQIHGRSAAH